MSGNPAKYELLIKQCLRSILNISGNFGNGFSENMLNFIRKTLESRRSIDVRQAYEVCTCRRFAQSFTFDSAYESLHFPIRTLVS